MTDLEVGRKVRSADKNPEIRDNFGMFDRWRLEKIVDAEVLNPLPTENHFRPPR